VWWPLTEVAPDAGLAPGTERRRPPKAVRTAAHWLVLLLAFGGALAVAARSREPGLEAALVLAALVFLLRCVLDPYTFSYHHWPFLVSLAAYEVIGRRRLPFLAAAAAGCLWWISYKVAPGGHAAALNRAYLAWTIPFAIGLAWLTARAVRLSARRAPRPPAAAG
jgi:hypothetical protein